MTQAHAAEYDRKLAIRRRKVAFNRHVLRLSGPNACWEWTGPWDGGYGLWCHDGITERAHRVAYELWAGPVLREEMVCHRCDNPPCVRPSHLFRGDAKANNRDAITKGRARWAFGEGHGRVKLTEEGVRLIRSDHAAGRSLSGLARDY